MKRFWYGWTAYVLAALFFVIAIIPGIAACVAPAVVQSATNGTVGFASSLTATFGSAPIVGDMLLAFVGVGDTSDVITPPTGWSLAKDSFGTACQQMTFPAGSQGAQVFIKIATDTTTAFTFTNNHNDTYSIRLMEVSGAGPIDVCAGFEPPKNTVTSSGVMQTASILPSTANELPIVEFAPSTSGLTITPKQGWTSLLYNNTQTPYMTLDVEWGPLTAIGSGGHGAGLVFDVQKQIFGTESSGVFGQTTATNVGAGNNITYAPTVAMLIKPNPNPTPVPTPTPTLPPTPTPSPTPVGNCCTNAVLWPATFNPYAASSVFNHKINNWDNVASNQIDANSSSIIANVFSPGDYGGGSIESSGLRYIAGMNGNDYGHPLDFVHTGDTGLVTVNVYCSSPNNGGAWGTGAANCEGTPTSIQIHAKARPATGADHHMGVVEPDGTEYDFWDITKNQRSGGPACASGCAQYSNPSQRPYGPTQAYSDWVSGDELEYMGGGLCGNFYTSSGIFNGNGSGAAVAGGECLGGGRITVSEMQNLVIPHALITTVGCDDPNGAVRFPGASSTHHCNGSGQYQYTLPILSIGMLLQVTDTDAQIAAMSITPLEKALLTAMHDYGMYVMDGTNDFSRGGAIPRAPQGVGDEEAQFLPYGVSDSSIITTLLNLGWSDGGALAGVCSTWPTTPCPGAAEQYYFMPNGWNPFGPNNAWQYHLRVLDVCNAKQQC